ncbi:response regulator [Aurantimonas endophytica]|nr:response regulator [Aurantimonas endophytica]MCO6403107.1 response regulator [Aurantimonas endophytica]
MAQSSEPPLFAVLVVDDEPLLLMDAMDLIEDAGFIAFGAANADAAIRILERQPDIRVLFTDVDMPGAMDGLELAHAVRHHWPSVAIIVTSGHVRPAQGELPADGIFFPKPYPPKGMIAALRDIPADVLTCGIAAPPSHPELRDEKPTSASKRTTPPSG